MGKYFKFGGLAQRSEYWAVNLIGFLVAMVGYAIAIAFMMTGSAGLVLGIVTALAVAVAYGWLWIATSVRRCRDADINPWWTAAVFVPYVGFAAWIVIGVLGTQKIADSV